MKHGGCADCGSKAESILTSIMHVSEKGYSKAVCSKCLPNYPNGTIR